MKKRRRGEKLDAPQSPDEWLSAFGQDEIDEIVNQGNTNFARGAFGEISIAIQRSIDNGQCKFVAIKIIDQAITTPSNGAFGMPKIKAKLSRDVFNEVTALQHLSPHPNIVPLLACYPSRASHLSPTSLSLAFVYSPVDLHLTLEWRRRRCMQPLGFDVIKSIAQDLCVALAHCHGRGVLHRDVKPGNLLVHASGRVMLCDFGLAKPFLDHDGSTLQTTEGESGTKGLCTLFYRPPEVLLGGPALDPAIDMYSAGTVLMELVNAKPVFEGRNVMQQLALVFNQLGTPSDTLYPGARELPDYGKLEFAVKKAQSWSKIIPRAMECPELLELLEAMMVLDPSRRIEAVQAVNHALFHVATKPSIAVGKRIQSELVPPQLMVPPLLDSENLSIAAKLAISMAARRRTFLSTQPVSSWPGPDLPTTTQHVDDVALLSRC